MTLTNATPDQIVQAIANLTDRPVVDKTELAGNYDVKFEATPAFRLDNNPDPHDIGILTARWAFLWFAFVASRPPFARASYLTSFVSARRSAVFNASVASTFTSGSTPTPSQLLFEKGLIASTSAIPIPK
jgi:hypothetical protein